MNVLVTGAGGYIGSVVVPSLLAEGHRVRACDVVRPPAGEPLVGDLCSPALQRESVRDIEAVVHLAAVVLVGRETADDLRRIQAVNVEATRGLVGAAKDAGVRRLVLASTCAVCGVSEEPADEAHPVTATSPYAQSKLDAERLVLAAAGGGFSPTVLRLATVFGASPRLSFVPLINALVLDALRHGKVSLFGASARRPFVHVEDVAQAVGLILSRAPAEVSGQIFNVGSERLIHTKAEIVALLQQVLPHLTVEVTPEADVRNYCVSFQKLARYGFHARRELAAGVREVADAVRAGEEIP